MPYHSERFGTALTVLAGHGHIKTRLIKAFEENLNDIDDAMLPGEAKSTFADLRVRMTRVAPLNGEGAVCASVRKMSIPEADECARTLVSVYEMLLRAGDTPIPDAENSDDEQSVPAVLLKTV